MSKSTFNRRETNPYPIWAPRFWHGMLFTDWIRLLVKHRCRVHPLRWGIALGITIASTFNSKMRVAQTAILGHRIRHTRVPDDPIFILGHWRSGTTLLHELLSVDDRFATPTTYQCFAANHFLLTEPFITRLFWFLMPSRRPMDNMAAGWHEPQEDEFALCAMGTLSPYLRIAFPNISSDYLDYLDLERLDSAELHKWKETLNEFLRRLVLHRPDKRLVLKSPTHTARIGVLAEMFPKARFIHIVRDPYEVVPSTLRLWNSLYHVQGLQIPEDTNQEDYVFDTYRRMYDAFERQRAQLADGRVIEIHYEHLVADGLAVLQKVYEQLDLGDFEEVRPKLQLKIDSKKNYQRNQHSLDADLVARINESWRSYFQRYGYEMRE